MIPIPIRDDNPRSRFPVVTVVIIAVNALVWLFELVHGVELSTLDYGAIPAWVLHGTLDLPEIGKVVLHQEVPQPFTILTSMFLHGSWLHIIGNMWYLWIFGDNVEDYLGHFKYLVFYLVSGVAAMFLQVAL